MEKEIRETSSLTDVDFDVILKVVKTSDATSEIFSALQDLKHQYAYIQTHMHACISFAKLSLTLI